MMLKLIKLVVLPVLVLFSMQVSAQNITAGGEVPWPLAHQYKITLENSRGLWKLEQENGAKYYNVEILHHVGDVTFLRVSELDPQTFEVISWGEGFFKNSQSSTITGNYYFDNSVSLAGDVGRYLYMYPNGDISDQPHMLRLVEVRTLEGISLGISIYANTPLGNKEHVLGSRIQVNPLDCRIDEVENQALTDSLKCDFSVDNDSVSIGSASEE